MLPQCILRCGLCMTGDVQLHCHLQQRCCVFTVCTLCTCAGFSAALVSQCLLQAQHVLQITGPTSFSGLESMLGDTSNRPGSMTAPSRESKEGSRKPSLLGRLAGKGNTHSHAAGSMSANDLQNALASSFGVRAAARADKAMSRK